MPNLGTVAAEARHRCHYCGVKTCRKAGWRNSPTRDHRIPLSRGGEDTMENVVLACWRCNQVKKDLTEDEFRIIYPTPEMIPHGPKSPNRRRRALEGGKR